MSKENTIVARRQTDGTLVQVLSDGSTRPLEDKTDWERLRAMTEEEVRAVVETAHKAGRPVVAHGRAGGRILVTFERFAASFIREGPRNIRSPIQCLTQTKPRMNDSTAPAA